MEERRRYVRIPESSQISYKCVPQEKIASHLTLDVSQGGLRFMVHEFIPKDTYMKIKLSLSKSLVVIEGMVRLVWSRHLPEKHAYEVGVQFVDIPPHAMDHLIGYISNFLKNQ